MLHSIAPCRDILDFQLTVCTFRSTLQTYMDVWRMLRLQMRSNIVAVAILVLDFCCLGFLEPAVNRMLNKTFLGYQNVSVKSLKV